MKYIYPKNYDIKDINIIETKNKFIIKNKSLLHIYGIIVNNTKMLSNGITSINSDNSNYSWDTILDFYYKDKENLNPTQSDIYTSLLNTKHINRTYRNTNPSLPDYINKYSIYYKHILEMLKEFDFND